LHFFGVGRTFVMLVLVPPSDKKRVDDAASKSSPSLKNKSKTTTTPTTTLSAPDLLAVVSNCGTIPIRLPTVSKTETVKGQIVVHMKDLQIPSNVSLSQSYQVKYGTTAGLLAYLTNPHSCGLFHLFLNS
jgi:hypothetical protein